MKSFYLPLTFLFAVVASLLVAPASLAAVHHSEMKQQASISAYIPGSSYYSFSTLTTTGTNSGTIAASNVQGGLTIHIGTDGIFTGTIVGSARASLPVYGYFQADGSIYITIKFLPSLTTDMLATLYPQKGGKYTGTFVVHQLIDTSSGILALVPVTNPQNIVGIRVTALTTSGPDQRTPYGGVMILDPSGSYGTIRLQDGRVLPVFTRITTDKITFTFPLHVGRRVIATGTPAINGTVTSYTGTFTGPRDGDSGDWRGFLFAFAA